MHDLVDDCVFGVDFDIFGLVLTSCAGNWFLRTITSDQTIYSG